MGGFFGIRSGNASSKPSAISITSVCRRGLTSSATSQDKANCGQRFVVSNGLAAIWRYNLWTTKLYDRTSDAISLDEIERIVLTSLALDCAHARENAEARSRRRVSSGRPENNSLDSATDVAVCYGCSS